MDAIKKKMQSLKSETDNSLARAEQLDTEAKEANTLAEKTEEHVSYTLFLWITILYNSVGVIWILIYFPTFHVTIR